MDIELSKEDRAQAIASLERYFKEQFADLFEEEVQQRTGLDVAQPLAELLGEVLLEVAFQRGDGLRAVFLAQLDVHYRSGMSSDRKSTRLNSSHLRLSRMPSSA